MTPRPKTPSQAPSSFLTREYCCTAVVRLWYDTSCDFSEIKNSNIGGYPRYEPAPSLLDRSDCSWFLAVRTASSSGDEPTRGRAAAVIGLQCSRAFHLPCPAHATIHSADDLILMIQLAINFVQAIFKFVETHRSYYTALPCCCIHQQIPCIPSGAPSSPRGLSGQAGSILSSSEKMTV